MKRLVIPVVVLVLFAALVYFVPILICSVRARPLYGNFETGLRCACGHEMFLYLGKDSAYENIPGHREKTLTGRIERHENSVTIYDKLKDAPWIRIDLKGSHHLIVFLKDSSTKELPQISNPWRTWLPQFLPE